MNERKLNMKTKLTKLPLVVTLAVSVTPIAPGQSNNNAQFSGGFPDTGNCAARS
jgi:hypothetical protein